MAKRKILAVNSFPTNGNAGLKVVMSILDVRCIPVPTLLLSGIGSIPGHERFHYDFEHLLSGTLAIARKREEELILYVGYLGSPDQPEIVTRYLDEYRDVIKKVLVDPVCGDQGKAYVPEAIIRSWHTLLARADVILPNATEVALLTGQAPAGNITDTENYVYQLQEEHPHLKVLVTSMVHNRAIANRLYYQQERVHTHLHEQIPQHFSGTGDAFASLVADAYYLKGHSLEQSMALAGDTVKAYLENSVARGSRDLLVDRWLIENAE